ncbi:MAG: hypothetical protein PHR00_04605 [Patescibacteria group bacterium]|nr:hypothetical protein [Patescibacteria group bacterium]
MKKKCLMFGIIICLALSGCTVGQLKIGEPRSPMSMIKAKKTAKRFADTTVIILPAATATDSSSLINSN